MASREIKNKILKHLSAGADTWSSTVAKVSAEVGSELFTEQAMKSLVEDGEIEQEPASVATLPKYQAPGAGEGKYAGFNERRLKQYPEESGVYEKPNDEPLTPKRAV